MPSDSRSETFNLLVDFAEERGILNEDEQEDKNGDNSHR